MAGENVSIWHNATVRADEDAISIGGNTNIQDGAVLHVDAGHPIKLGKDVTVGHGAILHGCELEDGVMAGMGCIIMNGAKVGTGSIIGAGALIPEGKEIPPNSLVMGVPGKVIRQTTEAERAHIKENADHYVRLADQWLK